MIVKPPLRHASSRLRVLLFLLLLSCGPLTAVGQAFHLQVLLPSEKKTTFILSIFDTDAAPRRLSATSQKGVAEFSGTLKAPCYAELHISGSKQMLCFFLEAGELKVRFNSDNPELSAVTGSRSNSQYRYLLEQCGTLDKPCVRQALEQYPDQSFAPYLLFQLLQRAQLPLDEQQSLFALLQGPATTTYHYRLLSQRLQQAASLQPGKPLPDLSFTYSDGHSQPLSSRLDSKRYNLLLIGATWCRQCHQMAERIQRDFPELNLIHLDLDREPKGWDAPYMQALAVEHIPFLLLLDPQGHILQHDLREWQLPSQLK